MAGMKVLALDAYHGGSHAALLDNWAARSRHEFTVLSLPAHKWKWRMRHGAITFAEQVGQGNAAGQPWDIVWCTDMLNLAEFRGLTPPAIRDLPTVVYFHENQLTYPVRHEDPRDLHFAMINFTTALAADGVWFNSGYHRDVWLATMRDMLRSMPDHQPVEQIDEIAEKAQVQLPGIRPFSSLLTGVGVCREKPVHLLWCARWEHDKNPQLLFDALRLLEQRHTAFRVSVIGQQFADQPQVFEQARPWLGDRVVHWGYQPHRSDYEAVLSEADVFVSTADHEFFGIAAVEAAAAGCTPVVPNRLAYPEVFGDCAIYYAPTAENLADTLQQVIHDWSAGQPLCVAAQQHVTQHYAWSTRAAAMDDALEAQRLSTISLLGTSRVPRRRST